MANPYDTLSRGARSTHAPRVARARDASAVDASAIDASAAAARTRTATRMPTAYELYFGSLRTDSPQRPQLEDAFFRALWVRHGTSKQTHRHRFDDLNERLVPLLPPERPLDVLDVAVSSGVSTLEWMQSLDRAGVDHRVLASDAVIDAYLLSFGGLFRALVDTTGFLMQLDFGGRAVNVSRRGSLGRLRFLPFIVLARAARRFGEPGRRRLLTRRALKLVSRSLLEEPRVQVVEDDIRLTGDIGRRFHVIRAANILNRLYFETATLARMVGNLRARLRPQGLLVVCRTMPDGHNDATVFRLGEDGSFSIVSRLSGGSEIEDIVLASRAAAWRPAP